MKKIFVILSLMLALSVAGGITAFAVYDTETLEAMSEEVVFSQYESRNGVELSKKLTVASGEKTIPLTYSKTEIVSEGVYSDIYLDAKNNEYRYNAKGDFTAFTNFDFGDMEYLTMPKLDDEKVADIAWKYAVEIYGDAVEGMTLDNIIPGDGLKMVKFAKKLGKDSAITGPVCYVDVRNDGEIFSCSYSDISDYTAFDESLFEDITEAELVKYASDRIVKEYGDDVVKYSVGKISVRYNNGKYQFRILYEVEFSNGVISANYYELEK